MERYSFFVIYANIDGFDPAGRAREAQRAGVGRAWTLERRLQSRSRIARCTSAASSIAGSSASSIAPSPRSSSGWTPTTTSAPAGHITEFVDALSNWYVRRSRDRFWAADKRAVEKLDAYWTLYECLVTTAKLVAPFVPFLAETLWQNLAGGSDAERERGAQYSLRKRAPVRLSDGRCGRHR